MSQEKIPWSHCQIRKACSTLSPINYYKLCWVYFLIIIKPIFRKAISPFFPAKDVFCSIHAKWYKGNGWLDKLQILVCVTHILNDFFYSWKDVRLLTISVQSTLICFGTEARKLSWLSKNWTREKNNIKGGNEMIW